MAKRADAGRRRVRRSGEPATTALSSQGWRQLANAESDCGSIFGAAKTSAIRLTIATPIGVANPRLPTVRVGQFVAPIHADRGRDLTPIHAFGSITGHPTP